MAKFVNSNGDEINADVVLWSGSHFGYGHDLTLNDDALKFKELIIISDDSAVIAPIIDGTIVYILVLSTTGLLLICPLNILNHQNCYTLIIADGQIHLTIKVQLLQKLLEDISHR